MFDIEFKEGRFSAPATAELSSGIQIRMRICGHVHPVTKQDAERRIWSTIYSTPNPADIQLISSNQDAILALYQEGMARIPVNRTEILMDNQTVLRLSGELSALHRVPIPDVPVGALAYYLLSLMRTKGPYAPDTTYKN